MWKILLISAIAGSVYFAYHLLKNNEIVEKKKGDNDSEEDSSDDNDSDEKAEMAPSKQPAATKQPSITEDVKSSKKVSKEVSSESEDDDTVVTQSNKSVSGTVKNGSTSVLAKKEKSESSESDSDEEDAKVTKQPYKSPSGAAKIDSGKKDESESSEESESDEEEALKLNNQMLKGRPVRLNLAKERGAFTPGSRSKEKPFRKGQQVQGTVYVRGFDASDSLDNANLGQHFGDCGEITQISIPKDYESGVPRGFAFIDFADINGFKKALELHQSDFKGCKITVEEAWPKNGANVNRDVDNRGTGLGGPQGRGPGSRPGRVPGSRGPGNLSGRGLVSRGPGNYFGRGPGSGDGSRRGPSKPSMATVAIGKKTVFDRTSLHIDGCHQWRSQLITRGVTAKGSLSIGTPEKIRSGSRISYADKFSPTSVDSKDVNSASRSTPSKVLENRLTKDESMSEERKEKLRFSKVGRKTNFTHIEKVNGRNVNVLQGLELHTQVFSPEEQKKIVDSVYEFQRMGQRGQLRERTYTEPTKWMRGKGRVTIQFGCCYNYAVDKNGNN